MLSSVSDTAARWSTALGCAGCLSCAPAADTAAWPPCPALPQPLGPVPLPATGGVLATPFGAHVDGRGSTEVGVLTFADNAGSIELGGQRLPAVIYQTTNPLEEGVTASLAGVAVAPSYLVAFWLLCAGDQLRALWHEESDGGPLRREAARGGCHLTATPTSTAVDLPASALRFPAPACGVEVSGERLQIHGGMAGEITLPADLIRPTDQRLALYPFQSVDCWHHRCAEGRAWYEVHALLSDGATRAAFGVFYLSPGEHEGTAVTLGPVLSFGRAGLDPLQTTFDAHWRVSVQ